MKKMLVLGLLAGASLTLSVTSCKNPDFKEMDENVAVKPLPPIPAPADTSGGKTAPNTPREINAANATETIKNMQPQM